LTTIEVDEAARTLGIRRAYVYRLLAAFRKRPRTSTLLPKDEGRKAGTWLVSPQIEQIVEASIESFYLQRIKPPLSALVRQVKADCHQAGLKPPDRKTILRRVAALDERRLMAAREGSKAARERYDQVNKSPDVREALERVQIDHTPVDLIVVDEIKREPLGRPWLSLIIDIASRMVCGLLTTLLCPRHGTQVGYACPGCHRGQLTVIWNDACLIVRCLRCAWRPPPPPNSKLDSTNHLGPLQLIFRLQRDIAAALRDLAPSHFWCGPITAVHFLRVVDDLYWLLRTPGLSARAGKKFTFTQDFTWTSFYREPRTLFTRTQYWSFCAWDSYSRAEVLVAIAAAMLGTRAFITLGRRPYYLKPTANYPWDWILPQLREASAQEFIRRVAEWPLAMRMPVTIATGELS
jgi:hypothetical protein